MSTLCIATYNTKLYTGSIKGSVDMAVKSVNVTARVEPEVKAKFEMMGEIFLRVRHTKTGAAG